MLHFVHAIGQVHFTMEGCLSLAARAWPQHVLRAHSRADTISDLDVPMLRTENGDIHFGSFKSGQRSRRFLSLAHWANSCRA